MRLFSQPAVRARLAVRQKRLSLERQVPRCGWLPTFESELIVLYQDTNWITHELGPFYGEDSSRIRTCQKHARSDYQKRPLLILLSSNPVNYDAM